jgi:hypothetical protein
VNTPEDLRTTHEEHFCPVRDAFLDYLDHGAPPEMRACFISKYTLLSEARKKALQSPFEPMDVQDPERAEQI